MESELKKLRKEIDNIDNKILSLLNKRMEIVKKVGELKIIQTHQFIDRKEKKKL
jgi:chorismate mutase/prephenate dehydratase